MTVKIKDEYRRKFGLGEYREEKLERAPEDTFWEKAKDFFEPVIEFTTGLKKRERSYTVKDPGTGKRFKVRGIVPQTELRMPFAKDFFIPLSRAQFGRALPTIPNVAFRVLELIPKVIYLTGQNYKEIIKKGKAEPTKPSFLGIDFDARRLGFDEEAVTSTGKRFVDYFYKLCEEKPPKTTKDVAMNAAWASLNVVVPDTIDVFIAGNLAEMGVKTILKTTGYDPRYEKAVTNLGLNPNTQINKGDFMVQFEKSLKAAPPAQKIDIWQDAYYVFSKTNGLKDSYVLKPFFRKLQSTLVDMTVPLGQVGTGGFQTMPMAQRMALPGYEGVPSFGLSIQKRIGQDISKKAITSKSVGEFIKKLSISESKKIVAQGLTIKEVFKVLTQGVKPTDQMAIEPIEPKEVIPPTAKKILGIKPSPIIETRKRETTLLKERIKRIQQSAKSEADKKAQIAKLKNEFAIRIEKITREGQLKVLKTGILERFKGIQKGIREGSIAKRNDIIQAGNDLKSILKEEGLPSNDKKWFADTLKGLQGVEDLTKKLPIIIERIERLVNAEEVRYLKTDIEKQLRKSTPKIKKRGVVESKVGPEVQEVINFLRGKTKESIKLTGRKTEKGNTLYGIKGDRGKALSKIEENINKYGKVTDGVTKNLPPRIAKQNAMLDMVGIQDMNLSKLREVSSNVNYLVKEGKLSILTKQANKEAEIERIIDLAKEEFMPSKVAEKITGEVGSPINPVSKLLHALDNSMYSLEGILEKATYGKDFKIAEWADDMVRSARGLHTRNSKNWNNDKVRRLKRIFGDKKLGKTFKELSKEQVIWKGDNYLGKPETMELSQFEAAYWWGLAKDPANLELFIKNMNFTPEMFSALDKFITPQMKEYTNYLMEEWLPKIRGPVAKRYENKFGMKLPNNPYYFPRLYSDTNPEEEITNLLFGDAFPAHPSTIPSGVKKRIGSRASFKRESIENVMRMHGEQMNQFTTFDEPISDLRRVFVDEELKSTIQHQRGGDQLYKTITKKIDDIARGGMAAQMHLALVDKIIGRFTKGTMMMNPVALFKQITSKPAFGMGRKGLTIREMIAGEFAFDRNPIEWTKMFTQSDFIFQRLTKGYEREMSIALRKGDASYTVKETDVSLGAFLKQSVVMPVRGGDMIPILPGMTAKYIQVTKNLEAIGKLSKEEIHKRALREAERLASRTQQDPNIESTGRIQTANSMGKAISMYSTTPIQYLREIISAARMYSRGQIGKRTFLRTLLIGWVILPSLFQFISDGGSWNEERQKRALILGPINYIPAIGDLITTLYDAFVKGETWKNSSSDIVSFLSIADESQKAASAVGKTILRGGDDEDWWKAAKSLYTLFAQTTGKVPSTAPRHIEGVLDIMSGDTNDPRRLFFSEWALEAAEENAGGKTLKIKKEIKKKKKTPKK